MNGMKSDEAIGTTKQTAATIVEKEQHLPLHKVVGRRLVEEVCSNAASGLAWHPADEVSHLRRDVHLADFQRLELIADTADRLLQDRIGAAAHLCDRRLWTKQRWSILKNTQEMKRIDVDGRTSRLNWIATGTRWKKQGYVVDGYAPSNFVPNLLLQKAMDETHNPFAEYEMAARGKEEELAQKHQKRMSAKQAQYNRDTEMWETSRMLSSGVAQRREVDTDFNEDNEVCNEKFSWMQAVCWQIL